MPFLPDTDNIIYPFNSFPPSSGNVISTLIARTDQMNGCVEHVTLNRITCVGGLRTEQMTLTGLDTWEQLPVDLLVSCTITYSVMYLVWHIIMSRSIEHGWSFWIFFLFLLSYFKAKKYNILIILAFQQVFYKLYFANHQSKFLIRWTNFSYGTEESLLRILRWTVSNNEKWIT